MNIVSAKKEFHEVVHIWPKMQPDEFARLVEDIRANGLREPVWLYQGKIIDGRHRYLACLEAGIEPRYQEWNGQGSLILFVASLNQHRRHLDAGQKAMVALKLEEELAKEAEKRVGGRPKLDMEKPETILSPVLGRSAVQAAALTGTSGTYVKEAKKIAQQAPELKEMVMNRIVSLPDAKKLAQIEAPTRQAIIQKIETGQAKKVKEAIKAVRQEERQETFQKTEIKLDHCHVYPCSVAKLRDHVEANSVDIIVTDPPYPKEFLPVYTDLARFAAYALKPGGSLLVMVGQSYLPEILQAVTLHVPYHWAVSYLTPGGQAVQLWQKKVNTFWKPVLWFVKDIYLGEWIGDVCKSQVNDNDKNHHHWGQSESGMADLLERFTSPGQLICDPFVGGGTTAVVATQLKRHFVGCDIDTSCVDITLARVKEVLA